MNGRTRRTAPVNTGMTVFTGGLNERVSNLELPPGELYYCTNYMELSGRYHGYTSVPGNERFDGRTSPSTLQPDVLIDTGIDDATLVLIESNGAGVLPSNLAFSKSGILSGTNLVDTVTIPGGVFDNYEWYMNGLSSVFSIEDNDKLELADPTVPGTIGWTRCIDFTFMTTSAGIAPHVLMKKPGSWEFNITVAGNLEFKWWDTGAPLTLTTAAPLVNGTWSTIRVSMGNDNKFRLYLNGTLEATSAATNPDELSGGLGDRVWIGYEVLGNNAPFSWDNIRFSSDSRCSGEATYTVPTIPYSTAGFYNSYADVTLMEAQRALITAVVTGGKPAEDEVIAITTYDRPATTLTDPVVVAARKSTAGALTEFYYSSATGWQPLSSITGLSTVDFCTGVFEEDNVTAGALANKQLLFWVSPSFAAAFYYWDGTTVRNVARGTGILPAGESPHYCFSTDNRLFLVYSDGRIYSSGIGDWTRWNGTTDNARLIACKSPVLHMEHIADNTLVVFMEQGISMLKGDYIGRDAAGSGTGWVWNLVSFNEVADVQANTAQKFGNTVYYVSKQGLMTINSSDVYGSFEGETLSHKVNDTLLSNLSKITGSSISKKYGQYRLFFDTFALYFTLNEDGTVKGATRVDFNKMDTDNEEISCVCHSNLYDNEFIGCSDGFVYMQDTGTSWDGSNILTKFRSAFNSYRTPRIWKKLMSLLFELDTPPFMPLTVNVRFGYDRSDLPKGAATTTFIKDAGGLYGAASSLYGTFVYGGAVIGNPIFYLYGLGVNFSIECSTESNIFQTHTINNAIADYQKTGRQV